MAHYAFLDENNVVVQVIVGNNEGNMDWEQFYANKVGMACKRTSYNTYGGKHPDGTPYRKNYAGIGYTYDPQRDAFIPPKPFESWSLNEDSCLWEPPVPCPDDGKPYYWDEENKTWVQT